MKRTTVKISDELDARLRHEAKRRQTTISEITREALEAHLGAGGAVKRPILMSLVGSYRGDGEPIAERVDELFMEGLEEKKRRGEL
jgi:hypothetical protein